MRISTTVKFQPVRVSDYKKSNSISRKDKNFVCENTSYSYNNVSFGSLFPLINRDKPREISPEKLYRRNYNKLANYFIKLRLINPDYLPYHEEELSALAVLDNDNVVAKYDYYNKQLNGNCTYNVSIPSCFSILAEKELDVEGLTVLCGFAKENENLDVNELMKTAIMYGKFDNVSTKDQTELIENIKNPKTTLSEMQIEKLSESPSLMRIPFFNDLYRLKSLEKTKQALEERRKNVLVCPIPVNPMCFEELFAQGGTFSHESLKSAFENVNLDRYRHGVPLKYPRENFIQDFQNVIMHLAPEAKAKVFSYFKFNIDAKNDMVGYPVPCDIEENQVPPAIKKEVMSAKKLVDAFMLENTITLGENDKKLEDVLNSFIKAFPEFISIIGKKHHRQDSLDNHTLLVLKKCVENPMTKELSPDNQKVLFIATMFHDISKKENQIDNDHPKYSAIYTKDIVKKVPISSDDKERIYELIKYSHWISSGVSDEEVAAAFRRKDGFKMAIIIAKADAESAGFDNPINQKRVENIYSLKNQIYQNGALVFADVLPSKDAIPLNDDGLRIIDFTDKDADLSKYGFKKGIKHSDLNFLCHSSTKSAPELLSICDDSKEICLSSILLNPSCSNLLTEYNQGCNAILSSPNSNICLAGSTVENTGYRRGFDEFKQYLYGLSYEGAMIPDSCIRKFRQEIPGKLKKYLSLDDQEYAELYKELDPVVSSSDIQDITLSNGRIVKASLIKEGIKEVISNLHVQINNNKNEVVAYSPDILAFVIKKELYDSQERDEDTLLTIKTAKENDIPIVLV